MPAPETDLELLAREIAMKVCDRRRAGESISDEEVLQEHPALAAPLRVQLERLHRLETARVHADLDSSDLAQTCDLPQLLPDDDSTQGPEQLDDAGEESAAMHPLRMTVKEQTPDSDFNATVLISDAKDDETTDESQERTPLYRPSVRAPMSVLKLYHDGMPTFTSYPLFADRFRIGRTDGDLVIPHDFWMSGKHAEIQRRRDGDHYRWFLVDLKSTNGTFVRADRVTLSHNDELFLGQERYRFLSDSRGARLLHVTKGEGEEWLLKSPAKIGRYPAAALPSFVGDPYLDPLHAELVTERDGNWAIQDRNSRNGIWYRVREVELLADTSFQLGEQRFGFWCHSDDPILSGNLRLAQSS